MMPATKAHSTLVHAPKAVRPKTIAEAAPTAAPADTPTTLGSASGLPNAPCMSAPATDSAAPTTIAIATRGNRTLHRVASARG